MGSHRRMERMYRRDWGYSFEQTMFVRKGSRRTLGRMRGFKGENTQQHRRSGRHRRTYGRPYSQQCGRQYPSGLSTNQFKPVARKTCCISTITVSKGIVRLGSQTVYPLPNSSTRSCQRDESSADAATNDEAGAPTTTH